MIKFVHIVPTKPSSIWMYSSESEGESAALTEGYRSHDEWLKVPHVREGCGEQMHYCKELVGCVLGAAVSLSAAPSSHGSGLLRGCDFSYVSCCVRPGGGQAEAHR